MLFFRLPMSKISHTEEPFLTIILCNAAELSRFHQALKWTFPYSLSVMTNSSHNENEMNKKTQQSLIILVGGDVNCEESFFSQASLFVGHTLSFLTTWHVKNWKKNLWNYFSHPRVSCQCQSSVIVIVLICSYFIIR